MRKTLAAIAMCGALGWMLVGAATPAMAGSFTLRSCQADPGAFSTDAFSWFTSSGMGTTRLCNPDERLGQGAIITSTHSRSKAVPRGSVSMVDIKAAPGTTFTPLIWAGEMRRSSCRWATELYAELPGGRTELLLALPANHRCNVKVLKSGIPTIKRLGDSVFQRMLAPVSLPRSTGATRIVQRVICKASRERKVCSTRGRNYIRTEAAQVDVVDVEAPTAAIANDTPLTTGAWVGGAQRLNYHAEDATGIREAKVVGGSLDLDSHQPNCLEAYGDAFASPAPCTSGPGQITVDTSRLPDGTQQLVVRAQDAATNLGTSAPVTARIDNTAPQQVEASLAGGDAWRNRNDFALSWVNPPENDRAPIVAATYKVCAAAGGNCNQGEQTGADLTALAVQVPGPGAWKASLWRRDAAGNQNPDKASVPVTLRYDPEPPQLGFEPSPAADPTAVSVKVTDAVSGLADGSIEISRAGSGAWHTLATQKTADGLTARIDDAALAAGDYLLRATARDQASNEASTTQRLDGQQMAVTLPLRIATAMQAGIEGKRTVRRVVRLRGKRRTIRRRVNVLLPTAGVTFGRAVRVSGRLTNRDGEGIAGADVQILSRSEAAAEQVVGVLQTDAAGRYTYAAAGSTSRVLRFAYAGSPIMLPAQAEVRLRVPATSTLNVNRPRVFNGQSVRFSGRVQTLPVPVGGKLVELQVLLSGRWQTFRTGRTDEAGRWRLSYGFARTRSDQRFRFRLKLPREAGYPYEQGGSRSIQVLVRGR